MAKPLVARANGASASADASRRLAESVSVLFMPTAVRDRASVHDKMSRAGADVTVAADISEAVRALTAGRFGLVVLDLCAERMGLAALRLLRGRFPHVAVVGLIDPAYPLVAGEAIPMGVSALLSWPFDDREFIELASNIRDRFEASRREGPAAPIGGLIAHSAAMRDTLGRVRAAVSGSTGGVMLSGESGAGRQLIGRLIHDLAAGDEPRPFIVVDCATEASGSLEGRLFGTETRAEPAGARAVEHVGPGSAIAQALGGTLYLTNLTDASDRVQGRLARLFRDQEAILADRRERIGLDLRPMAAVDPDVEDSLADGRLRRDLYDRLSQTRIEVPPLRRRREDLPALIVYLLAEACDARDEPRKSFSRASLTLLAALPWRGNGHELRGLVTLLARVVQRPVIQIDDVLEHASLEGAVPRADVGLSLKQARARFERECISATLIRHHGRVSEAAKALGLQRTNLYRKVRQLNVPRTLLAARR